MRYPRVSAVLLGSSKEDTKHFETQPVVGATLPEVARFLHSWDARRGLGSPIERLVREDPLSIERRLRWQLIENPRTGEASQPGLCIREAAGSIVGLLLAFPGAFLAGDQRLVGLGAGGFFVEPHARTLGFYLFKRYLKTPGYAFFFSTTCNADSGALWKRLGACAVPNSDTEYILPLDLEVMLPVFLAGRTSSAMAPAIARVVGRRAGPRLRLFGRPAAGPTVEPVRDGRNLP